MDAGSHNKIVSFIWSIADDCLRYVILPMVVLRRLDALLEKTPAETNNTNSTRSFMMDKRGEGVPIIFEESLKISGKSPVYEIIDNTELKLTIFAHNHGDVNE